jgi:hypothetical protein
MADRSASSSFGVNAVDADDGALNARRAEDIRARLLVRSKDA